MQFFGLSFLHALHTMTLFTNICKLHLQYIWDHTQYLIYNIFSYIYRCVDLPHWSDAYLTIRSNDPVMQCLLRLLRRSKSFWIWKVFSYCTLMLLKHVWIFTIRYSQYDERHITCMYLAFQPAEPSWLNFYNSSNLSITISQMKL